MKHHPCRCLLMLCLLALLPAPLHGAVVEYTYQSDGRMSAAAYDGIAFAYSYDDIGNLLTRDITVTNDYNGDLDNNGTVDLTDSILALQVISGAPPARMVHRNSDIDGDQVIGLSEALSILITVSNQ